MIKRRALSIKPLVRVSVLSLLFFPLMEVASIDWGSLPISSALTDSRLLMASANVMALNPHSLITTRNQDDPKADSIVANMRKAAREIRTLQADISTEFKNLQIVSAPEKSSGKVYIKSDNDNPENDRLVIDYTGPPNRKGVRQKRTVFLKGDEVEIYHANVKQLIRKSRQEVEGSYLKAYLNLGHNSQEFYVRDEKIPGQDTSIIRIVPNNPENIKAALVWVNKQTWLPVKFEVEYIASKLTVTVSKVRINGPIPDSLLNPKYPSDVKIVP